MFLLESQKFVKTPHVADSRLQWPSPLTDNPTKHPINFFLVFQVERIKLAQMKNKDKVVMRMTTTILNLEKVNDGVAVWETKF